MSTDFDLPIRDELRSIKPYESFDTKVIARMNTNENPNELSSEVIDEIAKSVKEVAASFNRYPSDSHQSLRAALCFHIEKIDKIKFSPNQILGANGSNEIMAEIFSAFGGVLFEESANGSKPVSQRKALTFSPTYSMYPQYARDSFTHLVEVKRKEDFSIDKDAAIKAIETEHPALVVIANPNNPTGNFTPLEDILEIAKASQSVQVDSTRFSSNPIVVVDEAYTDFRKLGEKSAMELVNAFDNLVVVRTLSKAFSFAGVRFGYAVANEKLINCLKVVRLPYNLSTLTQIVVETALRNSDQMLNKVEEIKSSRENLTQFLKEKQLKNGEKLDVIESSANFIMLGIPNNSEIKEDARKAFPKLAHDFLLERGIMIRVVGPVGYFRVTVGTENENTLFKNAFSEFVEEFSIEGER